jgi:hypothetical protein
MSLVDRALLEMSSSERSMSQSNDAPVKAVRIPVRHVTDWTIRADPKNGAHVELVLDGVPLAMLLGIVNDLKSTQ